MEVGSSLILSSAEITALGSTVDEVLESLTLPNPEYQNKIRFGRNKKFYSTIPKTLCYVSREGSGYVLPRYYFGELGKYGNEGRNIDGKFRFALRDYQQTFWDENKKHLEESTGILLEGKCGSGKTIMGLWISLERGKQTLVLVPTYYLAKQWQQRISEATTCSSIVIGSSDTEIPVDKDFTIVVMDLFSCRVLPEELVRNVGHVIMDEAHRIGAETYLPILKEIPAKYRTALTATFRRADGVHRILKYHFGLHLVMANEFPRPHVYAIRTGVTIDKIFSSKIPHERFFRFMDENGLKYHESTGAVEFKATDRLKKLIEMWPTKNVEKQELRRVMKKATDLSYPVIDGYLNDHSGRRKLMINLIRKCLDAGRTILFLSKRKDTLKALTEFFSTYKPMLIISETKERTPEEEAYLQNECRLIFGVTQLAKEGLDIDRIDTLIIHLPMKDTEQAIGRTTRIHPNKKYPVVFYPLDNCPLTYATFSNVQKFFKINAEYKGIRSIQTIDTVL